MNRSDTSSTQDERLLAAVDLGSNSFHMVVAHLQHGQLRVLDRLREGVRLGDGLDDTGVLTEAARQRALECLARFGQRIRSLSSDDVRAVGTQTLRRAKNARSFLDEATRVLGHRIEVISGFEEARLVYLGVLHSLGVSERRRLVIDIGGGSTELIVGETTSPQMLESLHMGCVSLTRALFADGTITAERVREAEIRMAQQLEPVAAAYRAQGWGEAVGASGTVKAVGRVLREQDWTEGGITRAGLERLRTHLIEAGHADRLPYKELGADRRPVFAAGALILWSCFQALGIDEMTVSDGAVREGLLWDQLGRLRHEDVRERSIAAMARRYHVDPEQAGRVAATAEYLRAMVARDWDLPAADWQEMLAWAAAVHEVGLDVSHSQYHKHGAYVLRNADMAGFSRESQAALAALVRVHRRKFARSVFDEVPTAQREPLMRLAVLLRLAVVLHRAREPVPQPELVLRARSDELNVRFPPGWLGAHPLVEADLREEANFLKAAGFCLEVG